MKNFVIDRVEYVRAKQRYALKIDDAYIMNVKNYILKEYQCPDNIIEFLEKMTVQDFYDIYNENQDIDNDILYAKLTYENSTWGDSFFDAVRIMVSEDIFDTEPYDIDVYDTDDTYDDIVDVEE